MSATTGTDTWNVSANYDQPSYTQGQTITVKLSGADVLTTTTTGTAGPLVIRVTAADGAVTTLNVPTAQVTMTVAIPESVKITAVQDNGTPPRTWTISPDGLTATAVA